MNIAKRLATAAVMLSLVFAVLFFGSPWVVFLFLQLAVVGCLVEFYNLARRRKLHPRTGPGILMALLIGASFIVPGLSLGLCLFAGLLLMGFYYVAVTRTVESAVQVTESIAVTVFGAVYVGLTLNFFLPLRQEFGVSAVLFLMAVIFLGDTGAFLIGKAVGRRKMTPIASPHKTWEGAVGGWVTAAFSAWAAQAVFLPRADALSAVGVGLAVSLVAQVSDPLESLFKRAAGVKDSSNALPGHGGILDRVDSLIFAAPLYYFLLRYLWNPGG
ncbi:MAG: phosphatidate cytidylyltransferase [Candidatus Aminicenantes bacterium]|nr:phosphatidate cytidylyltransferase [Candidatus Aminicenantes bacterium]